MSKEVLLKPNNTDLLTRETNEIASVAKPAEK